MFVRKKKNKSGVISIQVIDKSSGKYKLNRTIGSSSDPKEVEKLYNQGKAFIQKLKGQQEISFPMSDFTERVSKSIQNIDIHGIWLLLGKIYSEIGFDKISSELFKQLVIIRLSHPASKLKTTQYLKRYFSIDTNKDSIYRELDDVYRNKKELLQQISFDHTLKVLGGLISVVFYDVTTLYFQIDDEDEIRKRGFSKEGKHQNPQIILGLLVSFGGYPLAFDIFEGNKFEGHTMLPIVDSFKAKYDISKLVIIADSGLLSKKNIEELQTKGYEFILGSRIKNESNLIKKKILSLDLENGESKIIKKENGLHIVISYSEKRAKKDRHNRERGLHNLEKKIKSGRLTKANINNRGYNKYLQMEGDIKISIDMKKYEEDAKWDGLKGYITNTNLSNNEIIENYSNLWKIEQAFRISKHDLKIRPIYHRLQRRIEAHITVNFTAYKIYKELERQLRIKEADFSAEKAIEIAKSIYSISIKDPNTKAINKVTLMLDEEQKQLAELFDFN